MDELLIPIVAIICVIGLPVVTGLVLGILSIKARNKERMGLINQGIICLLYTSTDEKEFTLRDFPDRYKGEWRDNSDWLKLAFHAYANKPDRPYQNAAPEKMIADYDLVTEQIIRFAGEETSVSYTHLDVYKRQDMQTTSKLLMVRPAPVTFNDETAKNNFIQRDYRKDEGIREGSTNGNNGSDEINRANGTDGTDKSRQAAVTEKMLVEFDAFVELLRRNDVDVTVVQDTPEPRTPNSHFPNNWFSSHLSGAVSYTHLDVYKRQLTSCSSCSFLPSGADSSTHNPG